MSLLAQMFNSQGVFFEDGGMRVKGSIQAHGGIISPMGIGKVIYVDPANGADTRNGRTPQDAVLTLSTGFGKLTANQNDVLAIIGGASTATITDTLAWNKSYTHMVGIGAPGPNCRARITISGTDSAVAGLVVSGSGCRFENFRIYQGTSLANCGAVSVTGSRNNFWGVAIQGMAGALAAASANAYSLKLDAAQECLFDRCWIGLDTIKRTDGYVVGLDNSVTRCEFRDTFFKSYCETAAKPMVKLLATDAVDRSLLFKDCEFYNFWENHGGTLNECFTVPGSCQTHDIILKNSDLIGIAEWESNDQGQMWINNSAATAEDGGVMVEPINT